MNYLILSLLLICLTARVHCISKPRGVSPEKLSFYRLDEPFSCLDGSATIPWSKVNDDYCDCRDASDEPGTAACSNGFFYCENKQFKPVYIPSSRVNDGICDCCDGSDEYSGLASCKSTCWDLGKAAREAEEKHKKLLEEGHAIYQQYVKQVQDQLSTRNARRQDIENEIQSMSGQRAEAEQAKLEAEKPEKEAKDKTEAVWAELRGVKQTEEEQQKIKRAFNELDHDQNGRISVGELQTHLEFDIDQNGEVSPEEAKEYLDDSEEVDEATFNERVWKSIKDIYKSPEKHEDSDKLDTPGDEPLSDDTTPKSTEPSDTGVKEEYDDSTKELIETANKARDAYNALDEKFRKLEDEKRSLDQLLSGDYGPDSAFFYLAESSECYELTDREYTYKLCPFKETSQRPKEGYSGETSLGRWGRWEQSGVEEGGHYTMQVYENGLGCWNGPSRSTKVVMLCGPRNELLSASEPGRCEYRFEFATPAACHLSPEDAGKSEHHEEL